MEKQHRGERVSKQPLKRRTIIRELLFRILKEELALFPELFMAILEVEKGFGIPLGRLLVKSNVILQKGHLIGSIL
jgi:hypothetical protein